MAQVRLEAGELELVVEPSRGGAIMAFRERGFDLMRAWRGIGGHPVDYASFVQVPFPGRVDHGRFSFGGRDWTLPLNNPPEPHAIHGDGWKAAWRVLGRDGTRLHLELVRDLAAAPLRYRAEQVYELAADTLSVTIAVTNLGERAMPFGFGHHPYFDKRPGSLLSAEVSSAWMPDALNVPQRLEPVPIPLGFRLRRPVAELTPMDLNFQGWSGQARIDWPLEGRALEIEADATFRHLTVYVPAGKDYFCVEPVSMIGNAFNLMREHEGTGARVLEPGERLQGTIRFTPRPAAA